jgi:aspartyl-tRNA(Asn)/glutamyl-tRNA(Gln) amidotransferase subunit A
MIAIPFCLSPREFRMTSHTSRERLNEALLRIADPTGEGARACLTVYAERAREAADSADARAMAMRRLSALDGAIVTIKDLFDVGGETTRAGSKVLAGEGKIASADAAVVRRLRAAGAVIVAKTNMTEFAFSGVGLNPHFGTPGNPADRTRIPGGSTSGGAVAVADRMCEIAIGSDTGGSTRIPAALCGIVGFKPSKYRVPTDGAFPLSYTLDSIGPMARSVRECAMADAIMAGEEPRPFEEAPLAGLRLGIAQGLPLQDLDDTVAAAFALALGRLRKAGARLIDHPLPLLAEMAAVNAMGGLIAPEAYSIHRERLQARGQGIDPIVRLRIERGKDIPAADYIDMSRRRAALALRFDIELQDFEALLMPTVPIVAPKMTDVATPETFTARNAMLLRNTSIVNFFDLCAISLPLPRENGLPAGLMLVGRNGHDSRLFRVAAGIETILS